MNVKYKAIAIAGGSGIAIVFMAWLIFYNVYFGYIDKEHSKEMNNAVKTIEQLLYVETGNLDNTTLNWAYWDDSYDFINNKNQKYIDSNLQEISLKNLKVNMMIFLDLKGDIVYSTSSGLDEEIIKKVNELNLIKNPKTIAQSGVLLINNINFIVSSQPILKSDGSLPANGTLIMLRKTDEELIRSFQALSEYKFQLLSINTEEGLNLKNSYKSYFISNNKKIMKVNKIIKDINGEDNIVLSLERENHTYKDMIIYFFKFIIYFMIFMILILSLNYFLLNKYIFKRFIDLYKFIEEVALKKDTSLRINMNGADELFILSEATNNMLSAIDLAYEDIKKMDERFRVIMEATNDGYVDYYINTKEIYISPQWKNDMGYEGENGIELYKDFLSKIHPDCYAKNKDALLEYRSGKSPYLDVEYRVIKKSGEIVWVHQRGKVAEWDKNNNPIRTVSTLANITNRKKYEEEILYLSYIDKLTGLNNRAYMEKQFKELDNNINANYFIVMGDLNGLKSTNDALGHKEGDKLISNIALIFKEVCATDDIVSRWGGDEFIVLIQDKDEKYVSTLLDNIREKCNNIQGFIFDVSISLGYAKNDKETNSVESVMSLAEKRMYRNKLMENKSARNSITSSLLRTLHEKNSETEEHTIRIKNLSSKLGKRLGLSQDKLDELELLSLLHDIGKIGIPENILLKPSKLTEEEWVIMKSHTNIGYRIAKSTPELEHIAEGILYHHERYDGRGYPEGLKAEEIPLISRILNIVDSFDVMTNERVYKEAFSFDYAVEEIIRCSATQFDPFIAEEFIKLLKEENII